MRRGRRYHNEPKLNFKKIFGVFIGIILIIMFIVAMKNLLNTDSSASSLVSKSYFLINKNDKWGIIDNNAKTVIYPTYEDAIIIPDSKQGVFICTYDVDYNQGTYKTKVINEKGKQIFTEYDNVLALENYDENNNLWYEENVLLVEKNGKFGLINFYGNIILEINYDKIYTLKGIKNSIITEKDGKLGLVNHLGLKVVENKYDEIKSLGEDTKKYIVKQDGKYGIENILECKYQEIKPLNDKEYFCVKQDGKYNIINSEEEKVFSEKFDNIESIKDNIIVYKYKNKYCAYNIETKEKLDKTYETLKYTGNNLFIARTNNDYGIIDINNKTKIEPKYANINYYEDVKVYELEEKESDFNSILNSDLTEIAKGIISEVSYEKSYIKLWTEQGYSYKKTTGEDIKPTEILVTNNLFLSKQNDKYGFVDSQGNVVVDYIYDDAREQNEFGYVAVKKDGLWGSLDKNGKTICNPKYDLENNLLIDFIGEYHLGEDLNLMYYTIEE